MLQIQSKILKASYHYHTSSNYVKEKYSHLRKFVASKDKTSNKNVRMKKLYYTIFHMQSAVGKVTSTLCKNENNTDISFL